mgnify:CR=1 FL=1
MKNDNFKKLKSKFSNLKLNYSLTIFFETKPIYSTNPTHMTRSTQIYPYSKLSDPFHRFKNITFIDSYYPCIQSYPTRFTGLKSLHSLTHTHLTGLKSLHISLATTHINRMTTMSWTYNEMSGTRHYTNYPIASINHNHYFPQCFPTLHRSFTSSNTPLI